MAAGTVFGSISKMFGKNIGVGSRTMEKLGISGRVAKGVTRTKIMAPTAATNNVPNLITGKKTAGGSFSRSFVKRSVYEDAHTMRGRRIVGGATAAATGTMAMSEKRRGGMGSYRPPMPTTRTPMGSGRFA